MSISNISLLDFPVSYFPDFVEDPEALFRVLWHDLDWEHRENTPRREYWTNVFGRSYTYGRNMGQRTYESRPDHLAIKAVRGELTHHLGFKYEGCFLNGYETGQDSLGHHADDDPGIDHKRPIAVVTVGGRREIELRENESGLKVRQMLEPGSLLLMHAGMQSTHTHAIPKAGFVVKHPRISLTFRGLLHE